MVLKDNKILANKNFGKFTYSEDSEIVNKNTTLPLTRRLNDKTFKKNGWTAC